MVERDRGDLDPRAFSAFKMATSAHSCGYVREQLCRFGVVSVMFGIPKRVTSLCSRPWRCVLGLGADVSDN